MSPPLPLWSYLEAVLQRCLSHEVCALLLDYDGTLTPIASHPNAAHLSPTMQELLSVLASSGVGVVVGGDRPHSAAHYYVRSVAEVERFLRILSEST
jgi:trehalose-6-phosphatase